jgi:hypothetical protein
MRLLAYNHYLEKTVVMHLLSAACGTYGIILECNYYIRTKDYYFYSVSSDVSLLKKNYISLLIYNSDELVMTHGNRKNLYSTLWFMIITVFIFMFLI